MDAEQQVRLLKGLCFHCNQKFDPGHRCKTSNIALMEVTNGQEETEEDGEPTNEDDTTPMWLTIP